MALLPNLLLAAGQPLVLKFNTLVTGLTGFLTLNVAGSNDVTLTTTEAAHVVIQFLGLLTDNIDVIVPTYEKHWVIYNNTTGAFTLRIKTAAGTGDLAPQGIHTLFYCNGVHVKLALGTVGGALADGSVTYAKLQPASSGNRLLGTNTGDGLYKELTLTQVLDFTGPGVHGSLLFRALNIWQNLDPGTPGQVLQTQGVGASPTWASVTVTAAPVAAQYLVAASDAALTAERVLTNTPTLAWDFTTAGQAKADVPQSSITYAKIQNTLSKRLLGRALPDAGPFTELTLTEVLDLTDAGVWGELLFRSTNTWQHLAPGTDGQWLQTHGVGAHPTWSSGNGLYPLPFTRGQSMGFPTPLNELITVAAAASTTSTITIPGDSLVFAIAVRVTVAIPSASTFSVGVAGNITRYGTGISTAINTANAGLRDGPRYYPADTTLIITPNVSPSSNVGRIRLIIFYLQVTPPTS